MEYSRLRKIAGRANSAAKLERAFRLYQTECSKRDLNYNFTGENIKDLAWSAANSFDNRYGFYEEKLSDFFVKRAAIRKARKKYLEQEMDFLEISSNVRRLGDYVLAREIAKAMKKMMPAKEINKLREVIESLMRV